MRGASPKDASYVIRVALEGICGGTDLNGLRAEVASLYPKHDTLPAGVMLELAADAIEDRRIATRPHRVRDVPGSLPPQRRCSDPI
jgi:hypothetical protein